MAKLKEPIKKIERSQAPAYGPFAEDVGSLGGGITLSVMEHQHDPNRSMGYTPFFMVYGAEVVLPSDICHDSPRVAAYVEADNEKAHQEALDLLDEECDLAVARSAIYQQDLRCYHSCQVKTRTFQEGNLVLWLIQDQTDMHKLS